MPETPTPATAPVPDHIAANWAMVRIERGLSWEQLAEKFTREKCHDLAAWARGDHRTDPAEVKAAEARAVPNDTSGTITPNGEPAAVEPVEEPVVTPSAKPAK